MQTHAEISQSSLVFRCVSQRLALILVHLSLFAWQVCCDDSDDEQLELGFLKRGNEWTHHSRTVRAKLNMNQDASPWVPDHALSGLDRSKPRRLDAVDVGYWSYLIAYPSQSQRSMCPKWWADLSQGVERTPFGDIIPCITQDSILYSYELDRVLNAQDCFRKPHQRATESMPLFCIGRQTLCGIIRYVHGEITSSSEGGVYGSLRAPATLYTLRTCCCLRLPIA